MTFKDELIEERFWAKVDRRGPDECWLWTASNIRGYGNFFLPGKKCVKAHRFAYELLVGPIPDGLQLDHLCRVPACVNPAHLEPVSQRENIRRGTNHVAHQMTITHCPQGHPYDDGNTYTRNGMRHCRECSRSRVRAIRARRREASRG